MNAAEVIDQLEVAVKAAMTLARELASARGDADEWLRCPGPKARCPISGFGRTKIYTLTKTGRVRGKSVGQAAFYSGADVRRLLNQ